jgi:hypothetical protein
MGSGQYPHHSVALAQTRGTCQRAEDPHPGVVGLIMPGGVGFETHSVRVDVRAADLGGTL